ncbi:CotH kinase family protein [Panacibacter sp. DH6]|uniref:CotH kinase family protein n=1 Tax=Panacibacter microcysteis TaxID=2793269 RepID=A0A931E2S1_9BACT|nr:CotH kinase family protein [Panacibacter microcysteis]MBG9377527.1 CotH kinase family protein [Panacibacter microcysteis]
MKRLLFVLLVACCSLHASSQVNLTSSNLPIVIINTNGQEILDDPKITADMGIIFNGDGVRNNTTDPFNEYNGKIGIEIRGQSSQMFPMKSYSIELWDDAGDGVDKSIFGMPEESDWVLYAPYTDKTLMRNFLAYTMSVNLGHWAAHCRFVEVILNGNYAGVYVFMEKIKRDGGRVDIKKMSDKDNAGDAVTGGYIFSIDKEADGWFSAYHPNNNPGANIQFSYVYPKLEDITTEQQAYIKNYVDSFENALNGNDFQNAATGFRKFADELSFIDYFIVNEISRNVDGYRLSSYFYKDRNSINNKIIAGPVWDYDLAFRNADYCDGYLTTGWAYQFNSVCGDDYWQIPFWWNRFMQDSTFKSNLLCRWKDLRQSVLSNESIFHMIDSVASLVNEAQQRHFTQWPILGTYIWPNPEPIPSTYSGEIAALKNWLTARLAWLDSNLPNTGACAVSLPQINGSMKLITANPVYDFNQSTIYSTKAQTIYIRIVDVSGRTVVKATLQAQQGKNVLPSTGMMNSLAPGIYFFEITNTSGEKQTVKLLH